MSSCVERSHGRRASVLAAIQWVAEGAENPFSCAPGASAPTVESCLTAAKPCNSCLCKKNSPPINKGDWQTPNIDFKIGRILIFFHFRRFWVNMGVPFLLRYNSTACKCTKICQLRAILTFLGDSCIILSNNGSAGISSEIFGEN